MDLSPGASEPGHWSVAGCVSLGRYCLGKLISGGPLRVLVGGGSLVVVGGGGVRLFAPPPMLHIFFLVLKL